MMDALTIRRRVREMITTGELPCDDLAGLWDGKRCAACFGHTAAKRAR